MKIKPFLVIASAYCTTSTRLVLPALAIAPNDFSRIVVRPPALLPGLGLAFISAPSRSVYASHQRITPTSFSPPSRLTARRVNRCSAPYVSGVSDRITVPPWRTRRSLATPSAGLADTPEYPSEPPHCRATVNSLAGTGSRLPPFCSGRASRAAEAPAPTGIPVAPPSPLVL